MEKFFKFSALAFGAFIAVSLQGCKNNDDNPEYPDQPDESYITTTIGFENASSIYIGGPTSYGDNLYPGSDNQITTGYITKVYEDTYIQFPINYGYNYDESYNMSWCYTFYNGGIAVSDFHDMEDASYMNQLSVYNTSSPSGGRFTVANGYAYDEEYKLINDPLKANYSDFNGCAHVYLTDSKGYSVKNPGTDENVSGEEEEGWFNSVWITNTTYAFYSILNGNGFNTPLNEENKGWFKVQFIAFKDDDPTGKAVGFTEAYLANFDPEQADGYLGIIDEWIKVDLSMLPKASILVINFTGSDTGDYGLNTPAYCALDKFEIIVEK